jgi:Domain of unknown function (DUF4157)
LSERAHTQQTEAAQVKRDVRRGPASTAPAAGVGPVLALASQMATLQRLAGNKAVGGLVSSRGAASPRQARNDTGLPDGLKSGVERLSGVSLDDVRVHYDSAEPAGVGAEAYATGADIHVAPGRHAHLPHEAWHVVQQAQGRVQPTTELKDGVAANVDEGLEQEADVMGAKAAAGLGTAADAPRAPTQGRLSVLPKQAAGGTLQRELNAQEKARLKGFNETDKFTVKDFTSRSTGSGHFDLTVDKARGVAEVKVKLNIDMLGFKGGAQGKGWTDDSAKAWVAKAQAAISEQWNDKFDFLLEREGWPKLRVAPRFVIDVGYNLRQEFEPGRQIGGEAAAGRRVTKADGKGGARDVDATSAHYNVDLYAGTLKDWQEGKQPFPMKDMGELTGVQKGAKMPHVVNDDVRERVKDPGLARRAGCATFQEESADLMEHNAFFVEQIGSSERKFLDALVGDELTAKFKVGGKLDSASKRELETLADRLSAAYPPPVMKWPVILTGPKSRCLDVQGVLQAKKILNRIVIKDKGTFGNVKLTVDHDYKPKPDDGDVGSQVTLAHEFGHMIGLADEYNQPTPKTQQRVAGSQGVDALTAKALTSQGGGLPKFAEQQEGEVDLAEQAGVPSPNSFGMKTNSIMNMGNLLLPHHLTTVWEALGQATKDHVDHDWWKIVPHP